MFWSNCSNLPSLFYFALIESAGLGGSLSGMPCQLCNIKNGMLATGFSNAMKLFLAHKILLCLHSFIFLIVLMRSE